MMIEEIVLNYLQAELTVPVFMETPIDIPATYVLIQRTGGGNDNGIKSAVLAVQSIAPSLYQAAALNEEVKAALENVEPLDGAFACDLNSDYEFTNQSTKQHRYQAVFDVYY